MLIALITKDGAFNICIQVYTLYYNQVFKLKTMLFIIHSFNIIQLKIGIFQLQFLAIAL